MTGITNPDLGGRALDYNGDLKLTEVVDAGYYTQSWSYEADGAARSYAVGTDPATQLSPAAVFGLAGLALGTPRATVIDPRGFPSSWVLDLQGRPLLLVDAAGQPWRWERHPVTHRHQDKAGSGLPKVSKVGACTNCSAEGRPRRRWIRQRRSSTRDRRSNAANN